VFIIGICDGFDSGGGQSAPSSQDSDFSGGDFLANRYLQQFRLLRKIANAYLSCKLDYS